MADCKHYWRGYSEGVYCVKCGKKLTHDEYIALTEKKDEPKKTRKKKD